MNTPRHRHHVRGGWSLIELGIVVLIITILLAILINTFGESKGPAEATKVTLRGLAEAATEFEVAMTPVGSGELMLPNHASGTGANSMDRFVRGVWSLQRTRQMVENLGRDVAKITKDGSGNITAVQILDGWGVPIQYYDGKNDSAAEPGMVQYKGSYFASAGPDGKWGTVTYSGGNPTINTDAKDNMYSFELK